MRYRLISFLYSYNTTNSDKFFIKLLLIIYIPLYFTYHYYYCLATTLTSTTQPLPVPPSLNSMWTKQLEYFIYIVFTIATSTSTLISIVSPAMTIASSSIVRQGDSVHLQLLHFILLSLMCIYCDYISILYCYINNWYLLYNIMY